MGQKRIRFGMGKEGVDKIMRFVYIVPMNLFIERETVEQLTDHYFMKKMPYQFVVVNHAQTFFYGKVDTNRFYKPWTFRLHPHSRYKNGQWRHINLNWEEENTDIIHSKGGSIW